MILCLLQKGIAEELWKKIGHRAVCLHYQPEWLEELDYVIQGSTELCVLLALGTIQYSEGEILPVGQLKSEINWSLRRCL